MPDQNTPASGFQFGLANLKPAEPLEKITLTFPDGAKREYPKDITGLDIVDSFVGQMLSSIASISRVLDAETVVVGMRPAVAITLVELGLSLDGIRTALNVERGMELLALSRAAEPDEIGFDFDLDGFAGPAATP